VAVSNHEPAQSAMPIRAKVSILSEVEGYGPNPRSGEFLHTLPRVRFAAADRAKACSPDPALAAAGDPAGAANLAGDEDALVVAAAPLVVGVLESPRRHDGSAAAAPLIVPGQRLPRQSRLERLLRRIDQPAAIGAAEHPRERRVAEQGSDIFFHHAGDVEAVEATEDEVGAAGRGEATAAGGRAGTTGGAAIAAGADAVAAGDEPAPEIARPAPARCSASRPRRSPTRAAACCSAPPRVAPARRRPRNPCAPSRPWRSHRRADRTGASHQRALRCRRNRRKNSAISRRAPSPLSRDS